MSHKFRMDLVEYRACQPPRRQGGDDNHADQPGIPTQNTLPEAHRLVWRVPSDLARTTSQRRPPLPPSDPTMRSRDTLIGIYLWKGQHTQRGFETAKKIWSRTKAKQGSLHRTGHGPKRPQIPPSASVCARLPGHVSSGSRLAAVEARHGRARSRPTKRVLLEDTFGLNVAVEKRSPANPPRFE